MKKFIKDEIVKLKFKDGNYVFVGMNNKTYALVLKEGQQDGILNRIRVHKSHLKKV
jgi:hypothetical protein